MKKTIFVCDVCGTECHRVFEATVSVDILILGNGERNHAGHISDFKVQVCGPECLKAAIDRRGDLVGGEKKETEA